MKIVSIKPVSRDLRRQRQPVKKGLQLDVFCGQGADGKDLEEIVAELSDLGCEGLVVRRYPELEPDRLKKVMDKYAMKTISYHTSYSQLEENPQRELEFASLAGADTVTICGIPLMMRTQDGCRRFVSQIPEFVQLCRKAGLKLGYRNGAFEYQRAGHHFILDLIMAAHPSLQLELDTFWTYCVNVQVGYVMRRYAQRISCLHIADTWDVTARPQPAYTAIGMGCVKNDAVVRQAQLTAARWIVVGQDESQNDAVEVARLSLSSLQTMGL